jgi:hypothetical protein
MTVNYYQILLLLYWCYNPWWVLASSIGSGVFVTVDFSGVGLLAPRSFYQITQHHIQEDTIRQMGKLLPTLMYVTLFLCSVWNKKLV